MHFDDYQKLTNNTAQYESVFEHSEDHAKNLNYLAYPVLGLVGEAGEIANKVKKVIRGDKTFIDCSEELIFEIGDVLWYLAQVCEAFGLDLNAIARSNLQKLADRDSRGKIGGDGDNR